MSKSFVVAMFSNGDFEYAHEQPTEECADAYAAGARAGADIFGSELDTYVLPRDTADMRADQPGTECDRAMEAYASHDDKARAAASDAE